MNTDTKTPNKISANQIEQYMKKIIHHNQGGLISRMEGWFNICKSIDMIYTIYTIKNIYHMITLIKAEKAFGKI